MANAQNSGQLKTIIIIAIVVIIGVAGYKFMNTPENKTVGEKVGDAVDSLDRGEGLGDAADELNDRTPAEKLGDAVEDTGDKIENSLER